MEKPTKTLKIYIVLIRKCLNEMKDYTSESRFTITAFLKKKSMLFAPEDCFGKAPVCSVIVVSSESKHLLGFDLILSALSIIWDKKPVVNPLSEVWSFIFQFI